MEPITEIRLIDARTLEVEGWRYACAIGSKGLAVDKREGDLMTPVGVFPLRCCYWRPDRLEKPKTLLPAAPLSPEDGWCDDPAHPMYNLPVKLPFAGHHETLWRADHCYDLIIPLGYNDEPAVPGKGSAIFLHLMKPDGTGTEGCIAMKEEDLLELLPRLSTATTVRTGR